MMSSATSASPITVSNVSLGLYVEMAALRVIVSRHSSMVPGTQAPSLPSSAGNEQPDWAPMTQSQPSMSAVHGVVEPAPEVVEMNGEDVVEMNAEATAATSDEGCGAGGIGAFALSGLVVLGGRASRPRR